MGTVSFQQLLFKMCTNLKGITRKIISVWSSCNIYLNINLLYYVSLILDGFLLCLYLALRSKEILNYLQNHEELCTFGTDQNGTYHFNSFREETLGLLADSIFMSNNE